MAEGSFTVPRLAVPLGMMITTAPKPHRYGSIGPRGPWDLWVLGGEDGSGSLGGCLGDHRLSLQFRFFSNAESSTGSGVREAMFRPPNLGLTGKAVEDGLPYLKLGQLSIVLRGVIAPSRQGDPPLDRHRDHCRRLSLLWPARPERAELADPWCRNSQALHPVRF